MDAALSCSSSPSREATPAGVPLAPTDASLSSTTAAVDKTIQALVNSSNIITAASCGEDAPLMSGAEKEVCTGSTCNTTIGSASYDGASISTTHMRTNAPSLEVDRVNSHESVGSNGETTKENARTTAETGSTQYPRKVERTLTMTEVANEVEEARESRDAYWMERIRSELELAKGKIEENIRHKLEARHSSFNDAAREKMNEVLARSDEAEIKLTEANERILALERENSSLQGEVEAGKAIIEQFSKLMAEKASGVCQYCRRNGTLRPIPIMK